MRLGVRLREFVCEHVHERKCLDNEIGNDIKIYTNVIQKYSYTYIYKCMHIKYVCTYIHVYMRINLHTYSHVDT